MPTFPLIHSLPQRSHLLTLPFLQLLLYLCLCLCACELPVPSSCHSLSLSVCARTPPVPFLVRVSLSLSELLGITHHKVSSVSSVSLSTSWDDTPKGLVGFSPPPLNTLPPRATMMGRTAWRWWPAGVLQGWDVVVAGVWRRGTGVVGRRRAPVGLR